MKPRRVVITIEAKTEAPIKMLRKKENIVLFYVGSDGNDYYPEVLQVQVNVVEERKTSKK